MAKEQVIDTDGQVLTKITFDNGYIYYLNTKDQNHRIGGPAVTRADGSQEYWVNGKRHRIDGPAVTRADGSQFYWVNGKRHRIDGPALIGSDGTQWHYVDGVYCAQEEYPKAVLEYKIKQLVG